MWPLWGTRMGQILIVASIAPRMGAKTGRRFSIKTITPAPLMWSSTHTIPMSCSRRSTRCSARRGVWRAAARAAAYTNQWMAGTPGSVSRARACQPASWVELACRFRAPIPIAYMRSWKPRTPAAFIAPTMAVTPGLKSTTISVLRSVLGTSPTSLPTPGVWTRFTCSTLECSAPPTAARL